MDFDNKNTVKVDFETMERLVRDSERLAMVKDYISYHSYLDYKDMSLMAGVKKEDKDGEKNGI